MHKTVSVILPQTPPYRELFFFGIYFIAFYRQPFKSANAELLSPTSTRWMVCCFASCLDENVVVWQTEREEIYTLMGRLTHVSEVPLGQLN